MRTAHNINAEKVIGTEAKGVEMIRWTCPACGNRQTQFWFGRADHYCTQCDKKTNLKGFN